MKLRTIAIALTITVLLGGAGLAIASQRTRHPRLTEKQAAQIALKQAPGKAESAELENEKRALVWSFDIRTADGGITEVLVNADTGLIVDVSRESAADEKAEAREEGESERGEAEEGGEHEGAAKATPRLSRAQASTIALRQASGKVESAELENEKGALVWSFDIRTADGGITEVLVNANTGTVVDVQKESAEDEAAEHEEEDDGPQGFSF